MKIGRQSKIAPARTNAELLELSDYSMDEDACVPVAMEDIERLNIPAWHWDPKTDCAWVEVQLLRQFL